MSMTRIMHVTFNMGIGGTEQVIRQLVTNLPRAEFDNQIVCIDGYIGELGRFVEKADILVSAVKRQPGFDWALIRRLRQKIVTDNVDIVHCHQYTPWIYGWFASFGTGARVILTEHGRFYPDRYRYKAALINPLIALSTHRIVAISHATRDALARYEFIPKSKIRVIYNGIGGLECAKEDVSRLKQKLGIPENHRVMGTVARLDPVKNQVMMLEAFAQVSKKYPHNWLLMVGDGPDRQMLEDKAKELAIDERTIFVGFIDQPALYLAAMDLFLLTSNTEGTSMTLLEAMSLGIPSVVTDVGGNPEIIEQGKTGLVTPIADVDSFARSIEQLIKQPELMTHQGERAQQVFFERFSVASMVENYRRLYQEQNAEEAANG
ncbi:glycosyltransferase [Marinobacter sp.]|uniref:glycosyltransferase n=1 Tax=Marinobacter sp. TaxID=50741 RepID=UPI0035661F49